MEAGTGRGRFKARHLFLLTGRTRFYCSFSHCEAPEGPRQPRCFRPFGCGTKDQRDYFVGYRLLVMTCFALPSRHCEGPEPAAEAPRQSRCFGLSECETMDQRDCVVGRESRQITHVAKPEVWTGSVRLMGWSAFMTGTAPAPRQYSCGCPVNVRRDDPANEPLARPCRSRR